MVNKARTTFFDLPTYTFGTITDQTAIGLVSRAARENASNPRYLFLATDQGYYVLCDKDGTLIYGPLGPIANHATPSEVSVSSDRLACIRTGTNLCLLNADGSLRWNIVVANLGAAKIGTLYVACFINTGAVATSGVQWRSLVDGAIVQNVYGVGAATILAGGSCAIAAGQTGARTAIGGPTNATEFAECHEVLGGRLWTHTPGFALAINNKIYCDKDGAYVLFTFKGGIDGVSGGYYEYVYDNLGAVLGFSNPGNAAFHGGGISPNGRQAFAYYDANISRLVIIPYTRTATAIPSRGRGMDVSDDETYCAVGCENGNIYIYRNDGLLMESRAYGGVNTPIALVRNYV